MYYYYLFIYSKYELLDSSKLFIYKLLIIITTIQEISMHIFLSIFRSSFHVYFMVSYIINSPWKKVFTSIPRTYLLHYTFFKVFLFYLFFFFFFKEEIKHTCNIIYIILTSFGMDLMFIKLNCIQIPHTFFYDHN